jgi:hypothetical protein
MTDDYEISADSRDGLIWTKGELLIAPPEGTYDTPHTDREVRERGINYYGGLAVTPPTRKGGDYAPATVAPKQRAGAVVPGKQLPIVPSGNGAGGDGHEHGHEHGTSA